MNMTETQVAKSRPFGGVCGGGSLDEGDHQTWFFLLMENTPQLC